MPSWAEEGLGAQLSFGARANAGVPKLTQKK